MNLFNTKCLALKYLQIYVYVHNKYECENVRKWKGQIWSSVYLVGKF